MYVILAVVAVLLLLNLLGMYFLQPHITFPRPPVYAQRPGTLAAVGGESIWLDVGEERVEAWLLPGSTSGPAPLASITPPGDSPSKRIGRFHECPSALVPT